VDELLVRYYRWALADCRREVAADFPLIRMVRNVGVLVLLEMMSGMREPDRLRHAELLVRRFHRHGAALADDR
jgi:hypothetical protein